MGDLTSVASAENGTPMIVIYGRFASTLSFFRCLTITSGLGTFTISIGSIQSWTMQRYVKHDVKSAASKSRRGDLDPKSAVRGVRRRKRGADNTARSAWRE